jgi:hypothetical protein
MGHVDQIVSSLTRLDCGAVLTILGIVVQRRSNGLFSVEHGAPIDKYKAAEEVIRRANRPRRFY